MNKSNFTILTFKMELNQNSQTVEEYKINTKTK